MKSRQLLPSLIIILVIWILGSILVVAALHPRSQSSTETVSTHQVDSQIVASGTVGSANEATIHFQTSGKVVYFPVKEGDSISSGQTIASLDTYLLQNQLSQALNTYRSTRDTFDQNQQNNQTGVLQDQQSTSLNAIGAGGNGTNIINDMAKRILDQNQATLDNSVINVQLANYALQLASLTAPFNGVLVHSDIMTVGETVTPATSFIVADPKNLIFKAYVRETDLASVTEGASVQITLSGSQQPISGTVTKIYPDKITQASGEGVYRVDITSDALTTTGKYGQAGTVVIKNVVAPQAVVVPSWVVFADKYVWVEENGNLIKRTVTVGSTQNGQSQITSGLQSGDLVVSDPRALVKKEYTLQ